MVLVDIESCLRRHCNSLCLVVCTGLTFSLTFRLNSYVKEHLEKNNLEKCIP